jgi:DNA-binding protein
LSRQSNVVYIGRKPPMSYVMAIITSFTRSNTEEVTLKARGQAITTAVDAAEITRRRFLKELNVSKITLGTDEIPQEEGGTRNVSTIEITLTRIPAVEKEVGKGSGKMESASPVSPIDLTSIGGIGDKRVEKLKAHGVNSVQELANSDSRELSEKLQISEKRVSRWIDEAEKVLEQ